MDLAQRDMKGVPVEQGPWHARRRLGVVAIALATAALGVTHSMNDGSAVVAAGSSSARPTSAHLVTVGEGNDREPAPWGTLVVGPTPADHFWVQGLGAEGYQAFAAGADTSGASATRSPAAGMRQLALDLGDASILIGARDGADPAVVTSMASDLAHLPDGVRFTPSSPSATDDAEVDPGEDPDGLDPSELLHQGSALVEVTMADGTVAQIVRVPGPAEGLTGILRNLRIVGPGAYTGETAPEGRPVLILDDPSHRAALVVDEPGDVGSLVGAASELAAAVDAAVQGR
ncbi:MAG: hypothetical protein JWM47_2918 [Acidimicrobiales bacterium]|nr:hypothetical protein [Acidimicrobiales bacterium]